MNETPPRTGKQNGDDAMNRDTNTSEPLVEYEPSTGSYRLTRPIVGDVGIETIRAVAEISNTDPVDMEPVYNDFDPQLLDSLYESYLDGNLEIDGQVVVTIANHRVTIEGDGTIRIYPPE